MNYSKFDKDYKQFTQDQRTKIHDDICDLIKDTYASKHHDYGPSFEKTFYEYGWKAPLVRMEDKMSRLKSLFEKGDENRKVKDESIKDTVIDLANYSIMLATELQLLEDYNKQHNLYKENDIENDKHFKEAMEIFKK